MTLPERIASTRLARSTQALLLIGLGGAAAAAPWPARGSDQARPLPWDAMAAAIVDRMAISPGERVLIVAAPGRFAPLVPVLRQRIGRAGGHDVGAIAVDGSHPPGWETDFGMDAEGLTEDELFEYFLEVDLAVMLPGAQSSAAYTSMQKLLQTGRARTIHFHWEGAYDLQGRPLPVDARVDQTYLRALFQTDYVGLAEAQRSLEAAMRGQAVRVTTPLGTDLTFMIGDRPVTKQDGDASARRAAAALNLIDREIELPAGAVRVAPLEESVNGRIAFPASVWQGQRVEGLVLDVQGGRVVNIQAANGVEAVEAELDAAGDEGRAFREFALGMAPLLAVPTDGVPWIPYYGYGSGVVRLSLGANTELGGAVEGDYVRWNFFTDATVTLGDDEWVVDGVLVR